MVAQNGVTAPEIAAKYKRALSTVQRQWKVAPDWPPAIGKRGKWSVYDEAAVDAVVRSWSGRPGSGRAGTGEAGTGEAGGPNDLLTMREIAAYTGLAYSTVRVDVSQGKFGEPGPEPGGVKRFRRAVVDEVMASRRRYRKSH